MQQHSAAGGGAWERIPSTRLGSLEVSRLGLGGMVLTRSFGQPDQAESRATLDLALDLGVTFLDTADSYAAGENETFIGHAIAGRRDRVVLASKFGLVPGPDGRMEINGRPDYIKASCERSLTRLGTDRLDLYYQHRVDPAVPIEETVGAMARLVAEGKVLHLGLCEVSVAQLRAAHAVHPITAVESEWSLWARQIENEVLGTARQLGVGIVPYSPLGRGFLAGAIRRETAVGADDLRGPDPRLHGENLQRNLALVAALEELAGARGSTPAQLALAWLLAQGDDVVPIPGVEKRELLRQNLGALRIELSDDELTGLNGTFAPGVASGNPDATLLREGVALTDSGEEV
jgi:aryl-alcohol dehydrogenase-like predicted oxidoreductase